MRSINYLPAAIAALAISSGGFAFAAEYSEYLEHKLTIALTQSYEGDSDENSNDNGSFSGSQSIVKEKISNKQVLLFLEEQGVIEDIKGWSIVYVSYDGEGQGAYLVHKDEEPINVEDNFYFDDGSDSVDSYTYKGKDNDTYKIKGTDQSTSWGQFGIYYVDGDDNEILDLYTDGTVTYASEYFINEDEDDYTDVSNLVSISIVDVVGVLEDEDSFSGLISGSAKISKGKVSDTFENNL